MNKLLCFVAFSLVAWGATWGVPIAVSYRTKATDYYKDGTTSVIVGERYALVWVKNWDGEGEGDYFQGFNADATLVNDNVNENFIINIGVTKRPGMCSPLTGTLSDDMQGYIGSSAGEFRVYLLDTRTLDGSGLRDELEGGNAPVSDYVSVVQESASDVMSGNGGSVKAAVPVDSTAFAKSFVPANAPRPLITSCKIEDKGDGTRQLVMTVKKTVPYLAYNVATGAEPTASAQERVADQAKDGKANPDETITFTVPLDENAEHKFFKVIRH